jgi:hypothetical protein
MSESSWFFKSAWASTYFRRTLEGQVFICPSPWIFGRSREYQLSDAQAEELVRRIGRAYVKGMYIIGVGLVLAVAIVLSFLADRPVVAGFTAATVIVLLVGACLGIVYRAAGSMLVGLSWTNAPREPYSLIGNLKKTNAIMITLPTWALAIGAIGVFTSSVGIAFTALASGKADFNVVNVRVQVVLSVLFGTALVTKLRAQRNAE